MKRLFMLIGMSCAILAANAQTTFSVKKLSVETQYQADTCRLTKEDLESEIRSLMRYNRIGITDDSEAPYLYVSALLLPTKAGCAGGLRLRIVQYQFIEDEWLRRRNFATIIYCNQSGIFTSSRESLVRQAGDTARSAFNGCLSEMEQDTFARK